MSKHLLGLSALLLFAMVRVATACDVPVYRYALERWHPDAVDALIIADPAAAVTSPEHSNLHLQCISGADLATDAPWLAEQWANKEFALPQLVVRYAAKGPAEPTLGAGHAMDHPDAPRRTALTTPYDAATLQRLVDSPLRQEIATRLIDGDAAVWIFLDGTNPDINAGTRSHLDQILRSIEAEGTPPDVDPDNKHALPPLRFSVLHLSPGDPAEAVFRELLLNSEDGLRSITDPIVFPIFGRGRLLYALAGRGINELNVRAACDFLVGPCTCEIKEDNPGVDLPFTVDWDGRVIPTIDQETAPLLTTVSAATLSDDPTAAVVLPPTALQPRGNLNEGSLPLSQPGAPAKATIPTLPLIIVAALILTVLAAGTFFLLRATRST